MPQSPDDSVELTPEQRRGQVAAIFGEGVLRMLGKRLGRSTRPTQQRLFLF